MFLKKQLVRIFLASVVWCPCALSDVVGSDIAVSEQGSYTFPQNPVLTANRIASFGWMQGGFAFQNAATACLFDSVFPVSGLIQLNGGTLTLNRDMVFSNTTTLQSLGAVVGTNHIFQLATGINSFPATTNSFQDTTIIMNGPLALNSPIMMQGNCKIIGNNFALNLQSGSLNIASNSSLTLKNIILKNVSGTNIQCADNTGNLILDSAIWDQASSYTFGLGSFLIDNTVSLIGTSTFYYTSSQTSTIASVSQLGVTNGLTLSIGAQSNNGIQPLFFTDASSILQFDKSYWLVTSLGMQIINGTVAFANQVELDILGASPATGLIIGNGISANDALLLLNANAALRFGSGPFIYNNVQPNYLRSSAATAIMIRALASQFYLDSSIVLPPMTFIFESLLVPAVQLASGVILTYNGVKVKFPILEVDVTCSSNQSRSLLNMKGNGNSLFLTKGTLPTTLNISSTPNTLSGNGNISGVVTLQDSNTILSWGLQNGTLQQNLAMNGGTISLSSNFDLANSIILTGSGTMTLGNNTFNFGQTDLAWTNTLYWNGTNALINVPANITLSGTWTFSGHCILDCNRKVLDVTNGNIVIERGSSLTIRNAILRNINGTNIRCNDSASSLTLDNCTWLQNNNYTFSTGSLTLEDSIIFKGNNTIFAYQSGQPVTIQKYSTAFLDIGFTFSYDPGTSPNLLQFADSTGYLILNTNATVHATMQGLNLLQGNITIQNNASIASETWTNGVITIDNGISLGDCQNPSNDCVTTLGAGAILTLQSGSLNYKNLNGASLQVLSNLSGLFIGANSTLNVFQPMDMGNAITTFGNNTTLAVAVSGYFPGTVSTQGVTNFTNLNPC